MELTLDNRKLWLGALSQRTVWTRAAKVGLPVGCIQSVINQGDVWWNGQATGLTLAKTIILAARHLQRRARRGGRNICGKAAFRQNARAHKAGQSCVARDSLGELNSTAAFSR